ncbi:MAG: UDP-N-acetylmuramate dehydrogenase [Candidatus Auribacterota bacterium]|nr:UDP-N-acetylmuramate dehydrogenase [Candidatus Auribacterota bacterium]
MNSITPSAIAEKICIASGFQGEIRQKEEMLKHTSFRIGGPVDLMIIPASGNDLIKLIRSLADEDTPYFILGRGSNLLISDRGVRGIVIQVGSGLTGFNFHGNRLVVDAGVALALLALSAADRGLSGLEFAAGIPGTVGGAVVMNAGSGGGDISQVVRRVRTYKPGIGMNDWSAEECQFGYRSSRFRQDGEIILEVEFKLEAGATEEIKDRMNKIIAQRKKSLPLEYPSAGSVFKNPPGDYAGRLIEAVGLKGEGVGDARISEKHANVIVNLGSACSTEVEELITRVRMEVKEKFKINLELELQIWR